MYEEEPKNPTRSVATENADGIGAGAQIRRLLHIGGLSGICGLETGSTDGYKTTTEGAGGLPAEREPTA